MATDHRAELKKIHTFPSLVRYLRDEMGWPIDSGDFEELTFEYTAEELGIDAKNAAKIQEIKRLRPLSTRQPWGIFFVKFEPKRLPVVALRRILSQVVLRKRASANKSERAAWAADDLLFVSDYGERDERRISFAHFCQDEAKRDLPTLKVLGWDNSDTPLHLDDIAEKLVRNLAWPAQDGDVDAWRKTWRSAFTLRHGEVIATARELSIRLAELARAIRDRIRGALAIETERGPLTRLMKAFQESLVHDLDADGFADMYAQTIAYGLLSARIANPNANTADQLPVQIPVTNPFLRELMETFLKIGGRRGKAGGPGIDFDELGVSEVVELLDAANMAAVVRDFGDRNPQEDPVIHFYELFLKEYDAKKRMQRGVFYTPRPVVSYIVRSVDELLRTEFGLEDGLADTTSWGEMARRHASLAIPHGVKPTDRFVTVLDPATGTGTFLVETIEVIYRALVEKWKRTGHGDKKILDLWNDYVPEHLLPRLHGYELLMAPYAIAHLKIGLKLHETGYRFGSAERARIYLTNALEPPIKEVRMHTVIPALAHEAEAVNTVKHHQRFTVVLGNPPYSGVSANTGESATDLVRPYYFVDGAPLGERNPKWLQDDYVKFVRLAETLLSRSPVGILGFITNHGYLGNPTFRGMRRSLLATFNHLRVLDLHGNSKRREVSPTNALDANVFEIQQGVAISMLLRAASRENPAQVWHADMWGPQGEKYALLGRSSVYSTGFAQVKPAAPFYLFLPQDQALRDEYQTFVSLVEIMPTSNVGFVTSRDEFVMAFDKDVLVDRMREFRDLGVSDAAILRKYPVGRLALPAARRAFALRKNWQRRIVECQYRPFDRRWICYAGELLERPRESVMHHLLNRENIALISARSNKSASMDHFFCSRLIAETKCGEASTQSCLFPLHLFPGIQELQLGAHEKPRPNVSEVILRTLRGRVRGSGKDLNRPAHALVPEDIFHYAYGVFHSPNYRSRYAEFLKIDFPHLPLTSSPELFCKLSRLGGELVALHLVEAPAQQALSARYDKATKAWRYEVARGQCLPATISFSGPEKPVVAKVGWSDDTVWIDAVKPKMAAADAKVTGTIGFRGVPEAVWNFHVGGYQVCEKWLKDRKDRRLTAEDVAHYHRIVIALYETVRLMSEIDEIIESHGGWPNAFKVEGAGAPEVSELALKIAEPDPEYGGEA